MPRHWIQTNTRGYPDQAYGPDGFENATPVDLATGSKTANIVLVAAATAHSLSGTVTAAGTGLPGAIMYVFDAGTSGYEGNATTIAGGTYTLALPPGSYKLWIQTYTLGYPDQAYGGDRTFAGATVITLDANKTALVVLAPTLGPSLSGRPPHHQLTRSATTTILLPNRPTIAFMPRQVKQAPW